VVLFVCACVCARAQGQVCVCVCACLCVCARARAYSVLAVKSSFALFHVGALCMCKAAYYVWWQYVVQGGVES